MFEQNLEEMKALYFIHPSMYQTLTASNIGINENIIFQGNHEYTYFDAIKIIKLLDICLI